MSRRKKYNSPCRHSADFNPFQAWYEFQGCVRGFNRAQEVAVFMRDAYGDDSAEYRMATHDIGRWAETVVKVKKNWDEQRKAGFVPIVNGERNKAWRWPNG